MTAETEARPAPERKRSAARARARRFFVTRFARLVGGTAFSSLTRRILVLNLAGLIALVSGILYLNQFRAGLTDARVESLSTQGEIIAGAIAASATVETNSITIDPEKLLRLQAGQSLSPTDDLESLDFPINPERVAPILRRLISPTRTRARIYDRDGVLILDSRFLYSRGQVLRFDLPPPEPAEPPLWRRWWDGAVFWLRRSDYPVYQELGGSNGKEYPEVANALDGSPASVVRVNDRGELIVSVAVPIQRYRVILGSLLLSTQGGDIDDIVTAERLAIVRVFLVAAGVTAVLSILLAGTIAAPLRRLAAAADRVRRGVKQREEIPAFEREDEIGHLARAFRDMTNALYNRMDAIESFAADVSHELKNPLTSLRSAVETLPLARNERSRERLLEIIQHDVKRLDRLITDISDASRLDAELAREDAVPVDVGKLLQGVVAIARESSRHAGIDVALTVRPGKDKAPLLVLGHDSRLGQVFDNLIDNAKSFSPAGGTVRVTARRSGRRVEIVVDDDGPGIRAEKIERIFERFYTDRPEGEGFGNNSGLGLSISRQIVEAHQGTIAADNRRDDASDPDRVTGARFIVSLPAES
ncbi:sensor histidine kinase [Oharaeibacter diazotrophicus]|uniref:histidine kinase n=1 Tax=Oharaeibacter diazotrophicus TaxID=1920512 RepID=A0A4R6RCN6_9HYPH|nr:sensor histidine kinase [Oharaeibacter diazotrophicus]TDP83446.1 two-component system sensor histidine kinase ChvG [Oharaeibacter diazotrophicus]BBE72279.1 alkaline phosphatase synthesis sensor protein PhoR [Pleomorphomonas sp. SM30]GLS79049.1 histidine kinase [Oharaeibacter diazotrophicus]